MREVDDLRGVDMKQKMRVLKREMEINYEQERDSGRLGGIIEELKRNGSVDSSDGSDGRTGEKILY